MRSARGDMNSLRFISNDAESAQKISCPPLYIVCKPMRYNNFIAPFQAVIDLYPDLSSEQFIQGGASRVNDENLSVQI